MKTLIRNIPGIPILFLLITELPAQNYRTVNPDRIGFFSGSGGITNLRIDSVIVDGDDTIYYPLKNIQEIEWECFSPYPS